MNRWGTLTIPPDYALSQITWVLQSQPRFAHQLTTSRHEQGWSQQDLVGRFNALYGQHWVQTTLARIENGRRDVKLDEALALAVLLKKPLSDLIGGPQVGGAPSQ